jgi:hypothetical protein
MRDKIIQYLYSKEVKPGLQGFGYLITAIDLCLTDKKHLTFTCNLYAEVGNEHDITQSKAERCIRTAIESSNKRERNSDFIARAYYELEGK